MTGGRRDIREGERTAPLVPSRRVDDEPTASDRLAVTHLLGREPQGGYRVVVRNSVTGWPVVILNQPLLADGTPMPTRYWLVGEPERTMVSRLESRGGVHRAEDVVGTGPKEGARAVASFAYEDVDLTDPENLAVFPIDTQLLAGQYQILGFIDIDGNADPNNPDPDRGDPVTIPIGDYELSCAEQPVRVEFAILRP